MSIRTGTILDERWELVERLASGGMGEVFRAHDRRLDRQTAIKVLHTQDAIARQRFEAEVATLAKLQHGNIVPLFDAGEHDGAPFLVMAYVEGPSLAERLADGPMGLAATARFGREVAWALTYAHEQGIVHRDVKPSNVLFDRDGTAHLADFGIARLVDVAGITATGVTMGTAAYIAPEQLSSDAEVGPPADVYALGLVLLEAVTGRRQFDGHPTEAALARLSRDPEVPADLPPAWQQLLGEATARDPGARPSAGEVAALLDAAPHDERTRTMELAEAAEDVGGSAGTTTVLASGPSAAPEDPDPDARPARRWLPYLAVALVTLVALVVLVDGQDGQEEQAGQDGQQEDVVDGTGDEASAARDSDLPAELQEALRTLHGTVQP